MVVTLRKCTRCGLHPQNLRKTVLKGLCCNKCPNHGPWCTKYHVPLVNQDLSPADLHFPAVLVANIDEADIDMHSAIQSEAEQRIECCSPVLSKSRPVEQGSGSSQYLPQMLLGSPGNAVVQQVLNSDDSDEVPALGAPCVASEAGSHMEIASASTASPSEEEACQAQQKESLGKKNLIALQSEMMQSLQADKRVPKSVVADPPAQTTPTMDQADRSRETSGKYLHATSTVAASEASTADKQVLGECLPTKPQRHPPGRVASSAVQSCGFAEVAVVEASREDSSPPISESHNLGKRSPLTPQSAMMQSPQVVAALERRRHAHGSAASGHDCSQASGVAPSVGTNAGGEEEPLQSWEEELRRRTSPANIDFSRCLARTYANGRGGQCGNIPKVGRLCMRCARLGPEPAHGFVHGRVPKRKWKAFSITEQEVSRPQDHHLQLLESTTHPMTGSSSERADSFAGVPEEHPLADGAAEVSVEEGKALEKSFPKTPQRPSLRSATSTPLLPLRSPDMVSPRSYISCIDFSPAVGCATEEDHADTPASGSCTGADPLTDASVSLTCHSDSVGVDNAATLGGTMLWEDASPALQQSSSRKQVAVALQSPMMQFPQVLKAAQEDPSLLFLRSPAFALEAVVVDVEAAVACTEYVPETSRSDPLPEQSPAALQLLSAKGTQVNEQLLPELACACPDDEMQDVVPETAMPENYLPSKRAMIEQLSTQSKRFSSLQEVHPNELTEDSATLSYADKTHVNAKAVAAAAGQQVAIPAEPFALQFFARPAKLVGASVALQQDSAFFSSCPSEVIAALSSVTPPEKHASVVPQPSAKRSLQSLADKIARQGHIPRSPSRLSALAISAAPRPQVEQPSASSSQRATRSDVQHSSEDVEATCTRSIAIKRPRVEQLSASSSGRATQTDAWLSSEHAEATCTLKVALAAAKAAGADAKVAATLIVAVARAERMGVDAGLRKAAHTTLKDLQRRADQE